MSAPAEDKFWQSRVDDRWRKLLRDARVRGVRWHLLLLLVQILGSLGYAAYLQRVEQRANLLLVASGLGISLVLGLYGVVRWLERRQLQRYGTALQADIEQQKAPSKVALEMRTEELLESDSRCQILLESTSAIPWEMEADTGIWVYVGPRIETLLGYPQEAWYQKHFHARLVHPNDLEEFILQCNEVISDDKSRELEYRLIAKDGRAVNIRNVITPAVSRNGKRLLGGLLFDITEKHKLDAEVSQAQKLEAVGRLAAGIAHEINTPIQFVGDSMTFLKEGLRDIQAALGQILGLPAALEQGALSGPAAAQQIRQIAEECDLDYLLAKIPPALTRSNEGLERVTSIVRAMKGFAHPDLREKVYANLNDGIENTLIIAAHEYKYVALVHKELGVLPSVKCHVGEINQVILNLVVNAAHAIAEKVGKTGEKGSITIRTCAEADGVKIVISDTGAGIRHSVRQKIFDPFFTTKPVGQGTGQGLAIARNIIVDKHGGRIAYDSEVGVGTTFTIWLPAAAEPAESKPAARP